MGIRIILGEKIWNLLIEANILDFTRGKEEAVCGNIKTGQKNKGFKQKKTSDAQK
jgi:hypothetical protein